MSKLSEINEIALNLKDYCEKALQKNAVDGLEKKLAEEILQHCNKYLNTKDIHDRQQEQ